MQARRSNPKTGQLTIQKLEKLKKTWKTHTFQVGSLYLHYFKSRDMTNPDGELLRSTITKVVVNPVKGVEYPFEVHFEGKPQRGHVRSPWILNASSNEDRLQWMEAIRSGSSAGIPDVKPPKNFDLSKSWHGRPNIYRNADVSRANSISTALPNLKPQHLPPVHMSNVDVFQTSTSLAPIAASVDSSPQRQGIQSSKLAHTNGDPHPRHPQPYQQQYGDDPIRHNNTRNPLHVSDAEIESLTQRYLIESDDPLELPMYLSSPDESSIKATDSSQPMKSKQQAPDSNPKPKLESLPNRQPVASNDYVEVPSDSSTASDSRTTEKNVSFQEMVQTTEKSKEGIVPGEKLANIFTPSQVQSLVKMLQVIQDAQSSAEGDRSDEIDGANAKDVVEANSIMTSTSPQGTPDDLKANLEKALRYARNLPEKHLITDDDGSYLPQPEWTKATGASTLQIYCDTNDLHVESTLSDLAKRALYIEKESLVDIEPIGEGRFGQIYIATLKKGVEPIQVAIKTAKKSSLSKEKVEFMREMTIMSQMMHPNIVRLFGVVQEDLEPPWIVLEYVENGNLSEFLMKNERQVEQLVKYMIDISVGMHYLAEKGLVHRDLAARNILVGASETCKVSDFGLLREIPKDDSIYQMHTNVPCPVRWMPPESISQRKFSTASDVWSFGVLQWEMLNPGKIPYEKFDNMQVATHVFNSHTMPLPRKIPSFIAKIMKACWQYNPEKRPSFLLISTFFASKVNEQQMGRSTEIESQQLTYYNETEKKAQVPFLKRLSFECDSSGREHKFEDHKITLRIPEGAVPIGEKVQLESGVTMYGPFNFPEDTQPISPILWLNVVAGDRTMRIPFQLILPHFLTSLSRERLRHHQIELAKANDDNYTYENGQMRYKFVRCDIQPHISSNGTISCEGLNLSRCFYCLQAKQTPELIRDADYYLVRIENCLSPQRNEVYFTAIYFLKTCVEALKEQFPVEEGFKITHFECFKFKGTELHIKVVPCCEQDHCVIALEPTVAKIRASDINFWKFGFDVMQLQDDNKIYPPRVKMTIMLKNPRDQFKLPVKFEGCSSDSLLDIDLALPLGFSSSANPYYNFNSASLSSSPSAIINKSQTEYQSLIMDVKQGLKESFKVLFPLARDWKTIGALLGVEKHVLDNIKRDEESVRDCLHAMLSEWLKQVDPPPTWKDLVNAIEKVDSSKAQEIGRLYM